MCSSVCSCPARVRPNQEDIDQTISLVRVFVFVRMPCVRMCSFVCSCPVRARPNQVGAITCAQFFQSYLPCLAFASFLHSFIPSFLHSFIPSFLHSFIPSFLHSFISSFLHFFISSFLHSFVPFLSFFFLRRCMWTSRTRRFCVPSRSKWCTCLVLPLHTH
jgi:hypothetical protein